MHFLLKALTACDIHIEIYDLYSIDYQFFISMTQMIFCRKTRAQTKITINPLLIIELSNEKKKKC